MSQVRILHSLPRLLKLTRQLGAGVLSMLSTATNNLAQLINYLNLEAFPGASDRSPLRSDLTLR